MIDDVKKRVIELLDSGKIKAFVGLSNKNGQVAPHVFDTKDQIDSMVLGDLHEPGDARYPLNKILIDLHRAYPDETFGVLVRGCDERGLRTLFVWNQLDPEKVVQVGIPCPQELADRCGCPKPFPDDSVADPIAKPAQARDVSRIEEMDLRGRLTEWMKEFSKCIKCYGCRDICPMCFCKECSLETDELIKRGEMPPDIPIFHLVRAVHMAGRCIDCGLCNEACPVDIPLRTLYKKVGNIIHEEFGYQPGFGELKKPPLNMIGS